MAPPVRQRNVAQDFFGLKAIRSVDWPRSGRCFRIFDYQVTVYPFEAMHTFIKYSSANDVARFGSV